MIRLLTEDTKIYLHLAPTDMRKSINTLCVLITDRMALDPSSGYLFLFRNRQKDKLKALYYEQNCFTLIYRRLEKGKYIFPKENEGHVELDEKHFNWILASDKYSRLDTNEKIDYEKFY